ncbi:MAG: hypothetical protein M3Q14_01555, partial [bacterium]|nr:hypothetical protein [bacterium]
TEQHILALMLMFPSLRDESKYLTLDMFSDEQAKKLFTFLKENSDFTGQANQMKPLQSIADYVKITSLQFDELYRTLELTELQYEVARLQERLVAHYVKHQKQLVAEHLGRADDDEVRRLLTADKELNNLLKQVKRN